MPRKPRFDLLALDIAERIDEAASLPDAAQALLKGLEPMGVLSLMFTDSKIKARAPGTVQAPLVHGITPAGFVGSEADRFIAKNSPMGDHARIVQRPFLWRSVRTSTKALYGAFWEAVGEFGGVEGLAVPIKEGGHSAGVSMTFATAEWSPRERRAMEFACYAFIDKARELSPAPPEPPKLTGRERDCIAFVAEGKTDWEISVIMGISQATAHQHVESARRKLGATTRAQAVARFIMSGLL